MLINKDEHRIQYTVKAGVNAGEIFEASYTVCPSPLCTCTDIDLKFELQNNSALEVSLSLLKKSVSKKTRGDANYELANSLVNDFDNNDWEMLTNLFLDRKNYYTENSNLEDLEFEFALEDIERDGVLISYNEILPFARFIIFEVNGQKIIVDDLYCVFPKCTCKDVHLSVTPFNEQQSIFPFMTASTAETDISYNYKSNKWRLEKHTLMRITPDQLMNTLQQNFNIQKLFGERHKTIRRLYLNYRRQNFQPLLPIQTTSIGRNDPCPCGSGKKYKKCCMLKIN